MLTLCCFAKISGMRNMEEEAHGSFLDDSGVVTQNLGMVFAGTYDKLFNKFAGMGVPKCTWKA